MANTTITMASNLYFYYSKVLLDRLIKTVVLEPLAERSLTIPKGLGKMAKWLRYAERHVADPADFILSEGTVPTDVAITTGNVTAEVQQYGTFAIITDLLNFTAIDPVIENTSRVLADEAAELVDTIIRNELDTNLPNQFANNKPDLANTGSGDVLTAKEALKAKVTLQNSSVGPHESGMYVCVAHPSCIGDLQNDTNVGSWVDINKRTENNVEKILNGEAGTAYGVRFLMSDNISSTDVGTLGGATVFSNLFMGQGCFGTVQLSNENVEMFIKREGSAGTSDPLNQLNTVGYKLLGFVSKYLGGAVNLTADRGVRIRAGSSFTP